MDAKARIYGIRDSAKYNIQEWPRPWAGGGFPRIGKARYARQAQPEGLQRRDPGAGVEPGASG